MTKGLAFLPEVALSRPIQRRVRVAPNLFILPESNNLVGKLKQSIENAGYRIENGIFLYFEGPLIADCTLYEIFQSYGLALTFFYQGRASNRAQLEILPSGPAHLELFIDEYDKFNVDPDDLRTINGKDFKKIGAYYQKILTTLSNSGFDGLVNSLDFFSKYLTENNIKIRLLYLNICLESLFLGGADAEGISYKLSTRCAYLLHKHNKTTSKQSTYTEVKNGYILRSKIIHGGDYEKESGKIIRGPSRSTSELDHVIILEEILKRAFKIIFGNEDLFTSVKEGTLGEKIDKDMILI